MDNPCGSSPSWSLLSWWAVRPLAPAMRASVAEDGLPLAGQDSLAWVAADKDQFIVQFLGKEFPG